MRQQASVPNVVLGLAAALAAGALLPAAGCDKAPPPPAAPAAGLYCYVGGTMRPAMEKLAALWREQTGTAVELDYGDSGSNMIKAETSGRGDLYVAHDPFHNAMDKMGLITEGWWVATVTPMIAVPKGNPPRIEGLKDLARPGVRVILTDAMYSSVGHINAIMFRKAGLSEAIEKNVVTRTRTGGEAANAVGMGSADATIVWDAVIHLRRDRLDAVPIEPAYRPDPKVDAVTTATFGPINMAHMRVTIDVLRSSPHPEAAKAFAEFAASPQAEAVWRSLGFGPPAGPKRLGPGAAGAAPGPGDAPKGSLYLYAGAGLRPALDDLIAAFRRKTGTTVQCDYGGGGMIISRLRLSRQGDLFMPGDVWYVDLAADEGLVASKTTVCWLVPVVLVPKGNPRGIRGLADLAAPGVRLGLGDPKACQVGRASQQIFEKNHIKAAAVEANLVYSSPTVNELGVQVKLGHLDAAIVWDAVAAQYADSAEAIAIPPEENVVSQVAVAVLKSSKEPAAAKAFVEFLLSPEGQALFRKNGYRTEPPSGAQGAAPNAGPPAAPSSAAPPAPPP
jgi:molybdate transport system substrate-binding protein